MAVEHKNSNGIKLDEWNYEFTINRFRPRRIFIYTGKRTDIRTAGMCREEIFLYERQVFVDFCKFQQQRPTYNCMQFLLPVPFLIKFSEAWKSL